MTYPGHYLSTRRLEVQRRALLRDLRLEPRQDLLRQVLRLDSVARGLGG